MFGQNRSTVTSNWNPDESAFAARPSCAGTFTHKHPEPVTVRCASGRTNPRTLRRALGRILSPTASLRFLVEYPHAQSPRRALPVTLRCLVSGTAARGGRARSVPLHRTPTKDPRSPSRGVHGSLWTLWSRFGFWMQVAGAFASIQCAAFRTERQQMGCAGVERESAILSYVGRSPLLRILQVREPFLPDERDCVGGGILRSALSVQRHVQRDRQHLLVADPKSQEWPRPEARLLRPFRDDPSSAFVPHPYRAALSPPDPFPRRVPGIDLRHVSASIAVKTYALPKTLRRHRFNIR